MSNAVIVAYARSPFTAANKGALAKTRPDDILAQVIKGVVKKAGLNVADVEDIIVGCAFPEGEQGFNIGRMMTFLAGLPESVAGLTVNRWCGSSMEAIHIAAGKIAIGSGDLFICGGVESMTRIPMPGYNPLPNPGLYKNYPEVYMSMGLTAEQVAAQCSVTRKAQEEFALASHQKAAKADMSDEIIPIETRDGTVSKDGTIRPDSTLEAMATLEPAFRKGGTVTAATSSPLTDGASAVIVCSEEYAKKHKLPILARIKATATAGIKPEVMGLGPIDAVKKALSRAGLNISDIDLMEINEAFSAQSIPCVQQIDISPDKVNIEGGAIALGHPLGASGARITGKAALLLAKHNKKYAVSTMCIGGGMGIATVLEKA